MMHLDPDLLYIAAFESLPPSSETQQHLASCESCRRAVTDLQTVIRELGITRASAPSLDALAQYYAAYAHVQRKPSPLRSAWRTIQATLTWDSRQQAALFGVRSGSASAAYRLLYATAEAEVELLVEPEGHAFRTHGEIITRDDQQIGTAADATALIQWLDAQGDVRYETESDASGLFSLRNIAPGTYRLSIISAASNVIEIEALEIM